MREIEFRGKTLQDEWIYGYIFKSQCGGYYIVDTNNDGDDGIEVRMRLVVKETVGQYTGLKDKNGKKIFEGDIVTGLFNYTDIIGHIVYGSDATFFIERKGLYGIGLNNAEDWLEVVGNIHDNKEPLREE